MITQNTLFILGAGASCPYNYPSGKELRRRICFEFIDNYKNLIGYKGSGNESIDEYIWTLTDFKSKFYKSSNKSIDLFLARNPKLVGYGKFAIALEILKAETLSSFREKIAKPEQDWYSYLYDRLTDTFLDKDNFTISDNNVSFITFNYDRSLEQFLFESLLNSFENIKRTDAASEIKKIPIIHIYGKVNPLPWEDAILKLKYKANLSDGIAITAAKNIQVMNEQLGDRVTERTSELISKANRIFFLGFGYAKENMNLLNFPNILQEGQKVYGTGLGLTNRELKERKEEFLYHGLTQSTNIKIEEKIDSLMLLKEYL